MPLPPSHEEICQRYGLGFLRVDAAIIYRRSKQPLAECRLSHGLPSAASLSLRATRSRRRMSGQRARPASFDAALIARLQRAARVVERDDMTRH